MPEEICPVCEGSGRELFEREGATVVRTCACQAARVGQRLFEAARIPRILHDCGIEQAPLEANDRFFLPQSNPQKKALEAVRHFVETYPEERGSRRGFLLMGKPGTGKSHLLAGALRELTLRHHIPCRYVEFFHLLSELKEGYSRGKSELEIIAPLVDVEVLAVDELGKGRGSEWELYVMDEIISRRYNAGKATLFATNYTLDKRTTLETMGRYVKTGTARDAERLTAETLEERVGVRIFSRLYEMCELVDMGSETKDYRRA
ncbi:MAG: ATP-binding protein [Deltaproteobacteria bacterium]|nr:ATP-binding protein [Deltaproteobacteria bacterium]